jgi:ferredoxin
MQDADSRTPFSVRLEPDGRTFSARADESLLAAAARAGFELASSCRNGTCRTCMSRLVAGDVAYSIEWPGLLAEEKAEGWILPCVAHARSDIVMTPPSHQ